MKHHGLAYLGSSMAEKLPQEPEPAFYGLGT
jgi:hypothetical protein